jgi:hypothetical protein
VCGIHRGFWAAAIVAGLLVLGGEVWRWSDPDRRLFGLFGILSGEQPDWFPFLPLVVLLPLLWWRWPLPVTGDPDADSDSHGTLRTACLATVIVGVTAFAVSRGLNGHFAEPGGVPYPPAYHDEYSYLLQAETFLQGRTWLPAPGPRPELFQQMHVLNEGRFASRYFPGVGLWLAPFVALGDPWLAQQTAHALCAVLLVWIGRELRDNWCGFVAGLLFALSPGLAIFSTLLLAHHPTLVGLFLFTLAFLRMGRAIGENAERSPGGSRLNGAVTWGVIAGTGLAWAMLCRPMTAAGVGLPFGLWFGWWLVTGRMPLGGAGSLAPHPGALPRIGGEPDKNVASGGAVEVIRCDQNVVPLAQRIGLAGALTLPLALAIGGMLWYSGSITGDPFRSPYQQYTDLYTPRHVYGFNNVLRGEQRLGPKVIDNYDRWAENLTPSLAARNVGLRLVASLRLTLGSVPLVCAVVLLVCGRRLRGGLWLIAGAIISLHLAHIPYWYAGIMDWHYILESAPYWLLLAGAATSDVIRRFRWGWPAWWWMAAQLTTVLVNTVTIPISTSPEGAWFLWRGRLPALQPEFQFARGTYAQVDRQIDALRNGRPAIVLVLPDPADRSLDFVTNRPSQTDILRVRVPSNERTPEALQQIANLFPNRVALVLDGATRKSRHLLGAGSPR